MKTINFIRAPYLLREANLLGMLYESPTLQVVEVHLEKGFANSSNFTTPDYQDDSDFSWN